MARTMRNREPDVGIYLIHRTEGRAIGPHILWKRRPRDKGEDSRDPEPPSAVGLAVGVIRNGSLEFFNGHGLADIASNAPITEDTVFRIGSITKPFTAIAVMQLWEQGLIDLDAPANDYLRAYELIPAQAGFRPATVRHLLTHTAGITEVQRRLGPAPSRSGPVRRPSSDPQRERWRAHAVARPVLPRRSPGSRPARHDVRLLESRFRHARARSSRT